MGLLGVFFFLFLVALLEASLACGFCFSPELVYMQVYIRIIMCLVDGFL